MDDRFMRGILLAILALLGLWVAQDYARLLLYSEPEPRAVTARGDLSELESTAIEIFAKVSPSVVFVTTLAQGGRILGHGQAQVGMGSGFVWDAAGHIVTNDHVVRNADQIAVRFGNGGQLRATVVGRAPEYELAVLRVRASRDYAPVTLGSSEDLQVGQAVFAIGSPFGLSRTLTHGLVSALERSLPTDTGRELRGVIQTDAAINPGNSGGPLLDSAGRLIGVNTAIASKDGSFAGVGFAVPVDVVNRVVAALIDEGSVPQPGIGIAALNERLAAQLGVEGVVVAEVMEGSPAEAAGLAGIDTRTGNLGDIITAVDGTEVGSVSELAGALEEIGIGNRAELRVKHGGKTRTVEVEVTDISKL